ncbi:hypothetical protein [Pseudomonas phage Ppu-503]|nr:hypothetical protein [Pseudomonas phage Ppu-503]
MRTQVSLLLAHGHPWAQAYPLGRVYTESVIVSRRLNQATMTETTLQYLAFAGAQSKDGHKLLMKTLKELANG